MKSFEVILKIACHPIC